jgi:hypothetical protein
MSQTEKLFTIDLNNIEKYKNVLVTRNEWDEYIGRSFAKIENCNKHRINRTITQLSETEKRIALNSRQLAALAIEGLNPHHSGVYGWQNQTTNLWNIINYGSEVLKIERGIDAATVLQVTDDYTQEVVKTFLIN